MRILLLTQYFPPETGAAQNRLADLARRLSAAGHKVTVLTSMPNYPQGRIFEGYRGRAFLKEDKDGLLILRVWAYVSRSRRIISRLLNYGSFALFSVLAGIGCGGKQDAIVVESPPLFLGISGILLSRWRNAPMIFNVSDLWPQSAVSMGIVQNRLLIRMATALENYIYRSSYAITGQTEGIVREIRQHISSVPVELITNGVDPEQFETMPETRQKLREHYGFCDRFVVGYTGLHGLAYDLDGVLQAAEQLKDKTPQVLFAFFGDGPGKQRCREEAKRRSLPNVLFFPPQLATDMPAVLSTLDATIIPLKNSDFFQGTLPARLFECMAARLPILLAIAEGEASRMLTRARGGFCLPPENAEAMAEAIQRLAADPELRQTLGESGRQYVCTHYDRRRIALHFAQLLPNETQNPVAALDQSSS